MAAVGTHGHGLNGANVAFERADNVARGDFADSHVRPVDGCDLTAIGPEGQRGVAVELPEFLPVARGPNRPDRTRLHLAVHDHAGRRNALPDIMCQLQRAGCIHELEP